MAVAKKSQTRYAKAPIAKTVKKGGKRVVSQALIKHGSSNLIPKLHVKAGDMVMLVTGTREKKLAKTTGLSAEKQKRRESRVKGKTGKVLNVFPKTGKIVVEGINIITKASKGRGPMQQGGQIDKEAPIFASKVMLYCTSCKKPTRVKYKALEGKKKIRICKKCDEALDT